MFIAGNIYIVAETIKEFEKLGFLSTDKDFQTATASACETTTSVDEMSPPRKRRGLFSSHEKHCSIDVTRSPKPSSTSLITTYVDNLPILTTQARNSEKPWIIFREDGRFPNLHKLLEKIMCIPATSAPVERIFSHGGLFMRPHRACLGPNVLSNLVFSKCNKHLK